MKHSLGTFAFISVLVCHCIVPHTSLGLGKNFHMPLGGNKNGMFADSEYGTGNKDGEMQQPGSPSSTASHDVSIESDTHSNPSSESIAADHRTLYASIIGIEVVALVTIFGFSVWQLSLTPHYCEAGHPTCCSRGITSDAPVSEICQARMPVGSNETMVCDLGITCLKNRFARFDCPAYNDESCASSNDTQSSNLRYTRGFDVKLDTQTPTFILSMIGALVSLPLAGVIAWRSRDYFCSR